MRFQRETFGDVVEQISDPALRIGIEGDAQGAAVRQVPDLRRRLHGEIGAVQRRLPSPVIGLFGQAAVGAQIVENLRIRRPLFEKGRIELPEMAIGGVGENQPFRPVENDDRRADLVEGADVGFDLERMIGAHGLEFGKILGHAGAAARQRRVEHVHQAAHASDHHMLPPPPGFARLARPRRRLARPAVEQFEAARHGVPRAFGVHRLGVGRIDPVERLIGTARPDRMVAQIEQAAQGFEPRRLRAMNLAQAHQFEAVAGNVAHPHDHPAADRPALGFEMAAVVADEILVEGLAPFAQMRDIGLQRLGLIGRQPGAEAEHAARRRRIDRQTHVALDLRLAARAGPDHDELGFRGEKGAGALDLLAQLLDFRGKLRLAPRPAPPPGEMEQSGDGGEKHQPRPERQAESRIRARKSRGRLRTRREAGKEQRRRGEAGRKTQTRGAARTCLASSLRHGPGFPSPSGPPPRESPQFTFLIYG